MSRPYAGYGVARIIDLRYPDEGLPRAGQLPAHPFADDPNVYRSIPMYDPAVVDVDPELLAPERRPRSIALAPITTEFASRMPPPTCVPTASTTPSCPPSATG